MSEAGPDIHKPQSDSAIFLSKSSALGLVGGTVISVVETAILAVEVFQENVSSDTVHTLLGSVAITGLSIYGLIKGPEYIDQRLGYKENRQ